MQCRHFIESHSFFSAAGPQLYKHDFTTRIYIGNIARNRLADTPRLAGREAGAEHPCITPPHARELLCFTCVMLPAFTLIALCVVLLTSYRVFSVYLEIFIFFAVLGNKTLYCHQNSFYWVEKWFLISSSTFICNEKKLHLRQIFTFIPALNSKCI